MWRDPLLTMFAVLLVFAGAVISLALLAAARARGRRAVELADMGAERLRLGQNEQALVRARQGDAAALRFLQQRAGDAPPAELPGYGFVAAWPTARARNDALLKTLEAEAHGRAAAAWLNGSKRA
jgi:hypothetical protein